MTSNIKLSEAAAVDRSYDFQPIRTCPRGVKVQLLGRGGVALYGTYDKHPFWIGWAPCPKIPPEIKELMK